MEDLYHPFRSATARDSYLAYYDEQARRWPVASESHLVGTSFGETFVRVSGPEDGPSLVLLPGDSENSLAWIPVIEAMSAEHRTYALDHIFDNGRSVYTRQMRTPDDFVRWLDELFTALELNNLNLMGHSYGGWQASLYALAHPERLEKLVLLAPASTVLRPPLGLMVRAMLYYFIPIRFVTKRYLYWYAPDAVRNDQTRATIDEMVEEFNALRKQTIEKLKAVNPTDEMLDSKGTHPVHGAVTLEQLIHTWAAHDIYHFGQIFKSFSMNFAGKVGPWQATLNLPHFN